MMKRTHLFTAVVVLIGLALPWAARADDPPTPAPAAPSYDDPAIHFAAPDGWTKRDVPGANPNSDGPHVVAMFVKTYGRDDIRTITLTVEPYDGGLDTAQSDQETQLRNSAGGGGGGGANDDDSSNSVFFDRKDHITLSNGMPARYLKVSLGAGAGAMARLYQYIIIDGKRKIIATYAGREGYFNDKDALDALSTLTVVLYPAGR
jgi:hypothetical protein